MNYCVVYFTNFDQMPFYRKVSWPNAILPNGVWVKGNLTESLFDRPPLDRKFLSPNVNITDIFKHRVIWPNGCLTEAIWRKLFLINGHFTKRSFDRKVIWTKAFFSKKWGFWLKVHFTERLLDRNFFFNTKSFHSIVNFVCPTFFVAARHHAKVFTF
jgi:hypothetical protein